VGLERVFQVRARGSTVGREVVGGVTTFVTMSYVVFVHPAVLGMAGMDAGAVVTATCLAAAFATALMGLWANYPIAGKARIYLNRAVSSPTYVAWVVLNAPG